MHVVSAAPIKMMTNCHYRQTKQLFTTSYIFCSLMSFLYSPAPLPLLPHHVVTAIITTKRQECWKQTVLIFSVKHSNFAVREISPVRGPCLNTSGEHHPSSSRSLRLRAFLVKVKVSTNMISVLLYFKLSLIKGSGGGGHSHPAVRVTHLISLSASQRAFQAARLQLPNLHRPTGKENCSYLERWHR